jgi:hypothetical protein
MCIYKTVHKTELRKKLFPKASFLFQFRNMYSNTVMTQSSIRIHKVAYSVKNEIAMSNESMDPTYYKSHSFELQKITRTTEEKV